MPTTTVPETCNACECDIRGTAVRSTDLRYYCSECYAERYTGCENCGCELSNEDVVEANGDDYCNDCYGDIFIVCNGCDATISREGCDTSPDVSSIHYCRSCFDDLYTSCADCGDTHRRSNMTTRNRRLYCSSCLRTDEWDAEPFEYPNTDYDDIRSQRRFGIELETSACPDHEEIREHTVFGCKPDGSVDGMEFVSPILYGDDGLREVREFCRRANRMDFEVNSACGYHLHCDLTNESEAALFSIALAYHYTYPVWTRFVSNARSRNYYCASHSYTAADCNRQGDFMNFVRGSAGMDRYKWCNWASYADHRTVEIRVHGGTLNRDKVVNWIKAHLRFIDAVSRMTVAEVTRKFGGLEAHEIFAVMAEIWDDTDLTDYFVERAAHFRKPVTVEESANST